MTSSPSRRDFLKYGAAGASVLPFLKAMPAQAGTDTLVVVTGQTINSLDLHRSGTSRASYQVGVNCYDRLLSFGTKEAIGGGFSYDYSVVEPELAESWETSEDGLTLTFKLKPDARFWDGRKVTAEDVKWSFDRAVSVGGFPTVQMKAGGLERPDHFIAEDEETFVIKLDRPPKLMIPDLAVPVPYIINSEEVIANATDDDPWSTEHLHTTPVGSGAFKVLRWAPGEQLVYERNDDWVSSPLPALNRIVIREVPSPATRRALVERGDVHMAFGIPDKDAAELADTFDVFSTPVENRIHCLCPNFAFELFQDANVRKAIAYAVPYEDIFNAAAFGRGLPLYGGEAEIPDGDIQWPRKTQYDADLDKARELMAASAYPDEFEVPLSISLDLASWMQPTALLVQEALGKIGITVEIEKIPGAN